jgi:CheY-like chemotaxis protein
VEDDVDHQQFVKIFLRDSYDISITGDGESALEMVNQQRYDLILMDINLGSGMNGLEAVRKIRELPQYKNTPITAVTANALVSQKNTYLAGGCTGYIAKPFRKKKLLAFIDDALKHKHKNEEQ